MTLAYRDRQLSARNATLARLLSLWRIVTVDNLDTVARFAEASTPTLEAGYVRSAGLAADYYRMVRPQGITTVEVPIPPPPAPEAVAGLVRGAALAGVVNGRRRGMTPERAVRNGFVKVAGSAARLVLGGGRETILRATQADPAATGRWQRVAGANSCEFCQMLSGRGFAYSEETSDFAAHDNCGCVAEPEFA